MLQRGYCIGREDALARRLGPLREAHFPVAVKGSRPECAGQTGSWRISVPAWVWEKESRPVSASQSSTLFFHKGEVMAWSACHPNHTIWLQMAVRVCPHTCVCGVVSKSYPSDWTPAHGNTHISRFPTSTSVPPCWEQWEEGWVLHSTSKNQHLTYSAAESKLLRKSCTYHGRSNTNSSFASAQNYSWDGSFCVSQLWCLHFTSARLQVHLLP